jgi:hypothetical protein
MAAYLSSQVDFKNYENPIINVANYQGEILRIRVDFDYGGEQFPVVDWRNVSTIGMNSEFRFTLVLTDDERQILLDRMENKNILSGSITLASITGGKTYYNDTPITYRIVNADPILDCTVVDTNEATKYLTGDDSVLVKGKSTAKVTFKATPQMGAAIDEGFYIIRNGDRTVYANEGTFAAVESGEFIISAEDSRGNITTKSFYTEMVDYIPLTVNIVNDRPDALGNVTIACTGNYFNDTFGAVHNTITAKCTYRTPNGVNGDWIDMTVNHYSEGTYFASANVRIEDFDQNQMYVFDVWVEDKINSIMVASDKVKSIPIFHWGENDFVFEVPVAVKGDLDVKGDLWLKGDGNFGNRLRFGDADYCYISEDEDDELTIHAGDIFFEGEHLFLNGDPLAPPKCGTWTPSFALSSAISSYTTRVGWYSKVGDVVTVGFFVKATCNSGYQNSSISIMGLPYQPMYSTAGGGMCSGAYISGGYDFQCYVAEATGTITTRVQSCNNTSTTNISTSASGCNYRNGGGEITLSGTISFIANS